MTNETPKPFLERRMAQILEAKGADLPEEMIVDLEDGTPPFKVLKKDLVELLAKDQAAKLTDEGRS